MTASNGEWPRAVPCKDWNGRDRAFRVDIVDGPHVVVSAPPGENGYLTLRGVEELRATLLAAQQEAAARGLSS